VDCSVFSATVATDAPSEVDVPTSELPTLLAAEPTAFNGIPGDLGEDDEFDSFAAAVPADSNQSSHASAPDLRVAAPDLEVTPSANVDDSSNELEATNDDEFGDFGASSAPTSVVEDGFSGSATADAIPDSTVEEDDDFGGFADAGAADGADDDDDFGGFADASPAAAEDTDDDFGAFGDSGGGNLGGGDFGSFSTSASPAPPAATTTPQPATQEQGVSDPAATACGLLSSSVFDGEDLGSVKVAAAEFLRRSLPPPQATDVTGVTGCPTLDQLLTGQASTASGTPAWSSAAWHSSSNSLESEWTWSGSLIEESLLRSLGMPLSDPSPETSSPAGGSGGAAAAQGAAILREGTPATAATAVFEEAATVSGSPMPTVAPSAATDDFSGFSDSPPGIQASSQPSAGMIDDAFGSFASNASLPSGQPGGAFGDFTTTAFDSAPQTGAAPSAGLTGDAFGDFSTTAPESTPPHGDAFFSGFDSAPPAGPIQADATTPSASMLDDAFGSFASNSASAAPPLSAGDAFNDFAASSGIPGPVSGPPSGVGLLDVDFLGMGGSGSSASSSLPPQAQFGMGDMLLASLDPLTDSAAPASSNLYGEWLARLPDLSFVLSDKLCRPPHGSAVKV